MGTIKKTYIEGSPGASEGVRVVRGKINPEEFAIKAHGNQKYGVQPYEVHLRHVVRVLEQEGFGSDSVLVAAAWCHDVAEDTKTGLDEIESAFGTEVRDIVHRVTDEPGSTRKERKRKTYPKIRGHKGATIIKLCDRIANVETSQEVPEKLAMYAGEYTDFKAGIQVAGLADALWLRLDRLLTVH